MGTSRWSDDFHRDRTVLRAKANVDAFEHNTAVKAGKVKEATHPKMNPMDVLRESRDSEAHPNTVALMVIVDVTGSMLNTPRLIQAELPKINGSLKGIVEDPQILFGAIGDAYCDRGPLQVGQFESGIEQDDDVTRIFLEGNGGGNAHESYELAIYFAARHTVTDCFVKRAKKGYLFIMGDEPPAPEVDPGQVQTLMGEKLTAAIKTEDIVKEAQEKWNIFFLIPEGSSHAHEGSLYKRWAGLLGPEHVLRFNPANTSEAISRQIGICEGTVKPTAAPAKGVTLL